MNSAPRHSHRSASVDLQQPRPELPRSEQDAVLDSAVSSLRAVILAAHDMRRSLAGHLTVATGDTLLMSHLAAAGPLSPGELAQRGGLAPSTATTVIDRLERAGLVRRRPRDDDRRSLEVVLTGAGESALALSADWTRAALDDLDRRHLEALAPCLGPLAAALQRRAAEFGAACVAGAGADGRLS